MHPAVEQAVAKQGGGEQQVWFYYAKWYTKNYCLASAVQCVHCQSVSCASSELSYIEQVLLYRYGQSLEKATLAVQAVRTVHGRTESLVPFGFGRTGPTSNQSTTLWTGSIVTLENARAFSIMSIKKAIYNQKSIKHIDFYMKWLILLLPALTLLIH